MKKRTTAIRVLSAFLTSAMICGSIPVKGQEMFGTGIYQETEAEDIEEFQDSQTNDFETNTESDTESDTEVFSSDDTEQDFQDASLSIIKTMARQKNNPNTMRWIWHRCLCSTL